MTKHTQLDFQASPYTGELDGPESSGPKKTAAELQADIDRFLARGGATREPRPVIGRAAPAKRPRPTPSITKDTRLEITARSGYPNVVVLRPAKVRISYVDSDSGTSFVTMAKRSDGAWLLLTKSGRYLGVLEEWSGPEPWAVRRLEREMSEIPKEGARLQNMLLSSETWHGAVERGARAWWLP